MEKVKNKKNPLIFRFDSNLKQYVPGYMSEQISASNDMKFIWNVQFILDSSKAFRLFFTFNTKEK